MSGQFVSCRVVSRHARPRNATLCHTTARFVSSCHVCVGLVWSGHVMSLPFHVMSRHVVRLC
jgi:hypothetical protein